ncbi:hypothetical protein NMR55_003086 [Vibrio cholerae]|nr:hypothetical protein [Vibrio cholerae]ELT6289918.1 hypothetical protein [Vibrio cholerae]ELU8559955.1 hypothetical protein [Vibrio cholerae]HDZ9471103.1 hypothetical protein [Vibrio cholerae]
MGRFKSASIYEIKIRSKGNGTSEYSVKAEDGTVGFSKSDLSNGGKIYLLAYPEELGSVAYVGQTTRSIKKRFYDGVIRQGYKWSQCSNHFYLFVWDVDTYTGKVSRELDCIESELTYAARVNQGAWPLHQTAIKFRWFGQSQTARFAPEIAKKMMNELYDYLAKKANDVNLVEEQRKRMNYLLEQTAI